MSKKHTFTENEMEVLKQVQNGSLSKTMVGRMLGKDEKTVRRWLKQLADSASSASSASSSASSDNNTVNKPVVAERVIKPRIIETKQEHWEPRTQIPYWKDEFPEELKNYTQVDIPYEVWSKYGKDWTDFNKRYYLKAK